MPHLQLDVSDSYPVAVERELARRLGELSDIELTADTVRPAPPVREAL